MLSMLKSNEGMELRLLLQSVFSHSESWFTIQHRNLGLIA